MKLTITGYTEAKALAREEAEEIIMRRQLGDNWKNIMSGMGDQ